MRRSASVAFGSAALLGAALFACGGGEGIPPATATPVGTNATNGTNATAPPIVAKRFHSLRFRASIRFPNGAWKIDDHTFAELHATDEATATVVEFVRWTAPTPQSRDLCTTTALTRGVAGVSDFAPLRPGIAPPARWTVVTDERAATPKAANGAWDGRIVAATEFLGQDRVRGHVALVAANDRECVVAHATTTAAAAEIAPLSERLAVLEATVARGVRLDESKTEPSDLRETIAR